jgi:hypothetical protein
MKRSIFQVASALAVTLTALASSGAALAESSSSDSDAPTTLPGAGLPHDVITYEERMPNGALIGSGLVMFGASYLPSVIVAAESRRPGDTTLYMPVAGPWMNLAQRDSKCTGGRCANDLPNKVLLVADGLFQGFGALQVLGGFLFPTTRTVTQTANVQVLPNVGSTHVGVTAVGSF